MNKIFFKSFGKNFKERGFAPKPYHLRYSISRANPVDRKLIAIKLISLKYFINGKTMEN